jgi:hypothetical protein
VAPETIFGIAVIVVAVLALVAKLVPKRQPPERFFKCSRCHTLTRHNNRTIEAWRNGKPKFFCQACHSNWLRSHPPQDREQFSSSGSASAGSGCLGVLVLFVLLPLGGMLLWAYA